MSKNIAKIVNILAPQLVAYDFESNRLGLNTFRNGGSPNVNNKTTTIVVKPSEEEKRASDRLVLFSFQTEVLQ
jgi:hypothetical protein